MKKLIRAFLVVVFSIAVFIPNVDAQKMRTFEKGVNVDVCNIIQAYDVFYWDNSVSVTITTYFGKIISLPPSLAKMFIRNGDSTCFDTVDEDGYAERIEVARGFPNDLYLPNADCWLDVDQNGKELVFGDGCVVHRYTDQSRAQ